MLESKWVLFMFLLFGFGQLLASEMTSITGTSAEGLQKAIQVFSGEKLAALAPSSALDVPAAVLRAIGLLRDLLVGIAEGLAWDYAFLDSGVGALFRGLILWPLTGMMSLMIVGYIRNVMRQ